MEAMRALQEEMAASRANQERIQADLVASQATSEELRRSNEELPEICNLAQVSVRVQIRNL